MTEKEFKDAYTVLSREDIVRSYHDWLGDEDEGCPDALVRFFDYIRFPQEGTIAYHKGVVCDATSWAIRFDSLLLGYFGEDDDPLSDSGESFAGYLNEVNGFTFRDRCTGTDELLLGEWFCERVKDTEGKKDIRRYWALTDEHTFIDSPGGELVNWLSLDGYVFDEWDSRFADLECFMDVDEILKTVTG